MRFHVGFSFRLKTLKKFLIPILIGLITYFGSAFFGFSNVYAYENLGNYYNFVVPEVDFSQYTLGQYNLKDILDLTQTENSNFYIYAKVTFDGYVGNDPKVNFILLDKYFSLPTNFGNKIFGNTSRQYVRFSNNANLSNVYIFFLNDDFQDEQNTQVYNDLISCLQNNDSHCSSYLSNAGTTGTTDFMFSTNFGVTEDLDINVFTSPDNTERVVGYYYYSDLPIKNIKQSNTNSYYIRTVKVNGTTINFNDNMPTYCDFYDCSVGGSSSSNLPNANKLDDFFVSNLSINDLATTQVKWSFNYFSLDFADSLRWQYEFFGRVDHGTYYSYEPINCSVRLSSAYGGDDKLYNTTIDNFTCSSNLSSYDNLYARFRLSNFSSNYSNLISNLSLSSNNGYINISPFYNGSNKYYIMDYFSNLSSDFNLLVSTQQEISDVTFKSTNDNILMASVSRDTNVISNFATSQQLSFGTYNNTNAMIYNYTPNYSNSSDVFVYIGKSDIISFVQNGTFTYYDSSNILSSGAINNTYQYIADDYDLNYYFNQVNEYINSIDNDLNEVHNIFEHIFSIMPEFLQLVIIVLYILLLSYLLFNFIRS